MKTIRQLNRPGGAAISEMMNSTGYDTRRGLRSGVEVKLKEGIVEKLKSTQ